VFDTFDTPPVFSTPMPPVGPRAPGFVAADVAVGHPACHRVAVEGVLRAIHCKVTAGHAKSRGCLHQTKRILRGHRRKVLEGMKIGTWNEGGAQDGVRE